MIHARANIYWLSYGPSCAKNLEARDPGARGHVPALLESMHDERGYMVERPCLDMGYYILIDPP